MRRAKTSVENRLHDCRLVEMFGILEQVPSTSSNARSCLLYLQFGKKIYPVRQVYTLSVIQWHSNVCSAETSLYSIHSRNMLNVHLPSGEDLGKQVLIVASPRCNHATHSIHNGSRLPSNQTSPA